MLDLSSESIDLEDFIVHMCRDNGLKGFEMICDFLTKFLDWNNIFQRFSFENMLFLVKIEGFQK